MANIKQQKKRILTSEKARLRNKSAKSAIRTAIKNCKAAIEAKDKAKATELANKAYTLIDKSVSDGIQHANTAARQKSTLAKLLNSLE